MLRDDRLKVYSKIQRILVEYESLVNATSTEADSLQDDQEGSEILKQLRPLVGRGEGVGDGDGDGHKGRGRRGHRPEPAPGPHDRLGDIPLVESGPDEGVTKS